MLYRTFRTALFASVIAGVLVIPWSVRAASTEQLLHSFNYSDGTDPVAGLIFDTAGNLYGTTVGDGPHGAGTAFELTPGVNGWSYQVIYNFCSATGCADGGLPEAALTLGPGGTLYGTASGGGNSGCGHGCGTVFQLIPSGGSWTEAVLYTFSGGKDGGVPTAGLISDAAGNLYGTTSQGGNNAMYCKTTGCGVVFELMPQTNRAWKEKVLHTFCRALGCEDGMTPNGLVSDATGNLYCTTNQGGSEAAGTVLRLSPGSGGKWTGKVLHTFGKGVDGTFPYGQLAIDTSGNLYGTTSKGGSYSAGIAFRISHHKNDTWGEKVLYSFCSARECADGEYPYAGLTLDDSGSLYGTTYSGGTSGYGTVFKIRHGANGRWTETLLFNSDNANPDAGLTWDTVGNLYSTTGNGGSYGLGSAFELTP